MTPEPSPTFVIDRADRFGVPTVAICSLCGDRWHRPPGDPNADTLPVYALDHRETHRRATGEQLRLVT